LVILTRNYRAPVRFPTLIFNCGAVELDIPAPVGAAEAVNVTEPRLDGRQVQVAAKLDPEPVANLFLHPGRTLPFKLKEIFEATVTVAVITIAVR
jgi:hypothetical protein